MSNWLGLCSHLGVGGPNHADLKAMAREVGALAALPHVYMKVWELLQSSESGERILNKLLVWIQA